MMQTKIVVVVGVTRDTVSEARGRCSRGFNAFGNASSVASGLFRLPDQVKGPGCLVGHSSGAYHGLSRLAAQ